MSDNSILNVIRGVVVSEKAEGAREGGQYVFRVAPDANKALVKRAVELAFKTEVRSVRLCNVVGRKRRFRFMPGWVSGCKKAYVRLAPGKSIEIEGDA